MSKLTEIAPGLYAAAQVDRAAIAEIAASGARTLINNRPDGEEPGQLPAAEAQAEAERLGLTYIHIPVTSSSIAPGDVAAMQQALATAPKPVVMHCRSGTRSTLLWAAGEVLAGRADAARLVAEAAAKGFQIASLPDLAARLRQG
jgi:sulfide:quinone oxidoreductase